MPFPLSYNGKLTCVPASGATILACRLAGVLSGVGLGNVYFMGDTVVFGAQQDEGRESYLDMLAGGELKISHAGGRLVVSYSLRFKGLLIVTIATALLGIGLLGMTRCGPWFPENSFAIAAVTILWLAVNYVLTVMDFASLMRRALRGF